MTIYRKKVTMMLTPVAEIKLLTLFCQGAKRLRGGTVVEISCRPLPPEPINITVVYNCADTLTVSFATCLVRDTS